MRLFDTCDILLCVSLKIFLNIFKNKLQVGLEPTTLGLEDPRATDCATEAERSYTELNRGLLDQNQL